MDKPSPDIVTLLLNCVVLATVVGGIAVWLVVLARVLRRQPVIRFEARRPVPWNGWDAVGLFLGMFLLALLLSQVAEKTLGWKFEKPQKMPHAAAPAGEDLDLERAHPIVVLLSSDLNRAVVFLCLFSAVVLAPIHEEFTFRLVMQGAFENIDARYRRLFRYPGRWLGLAPVVMSSLVFASLHFRVPRPRQPEEIMHLLIIDAVARVLLVAGGIIYLRRIRLASWSDLGIRFDKFLTDLGLAGTTFVAVIVPIYVIQIELAKRFPEIVPDPLPLFLLALALGYLYFRTHRITPCILLHLIFNGSSMAMFFATTPAH
ncbi:MAG: CPBP family intramembrane metalloprotease [Planctomycetaceae bacterium]|nr:CPBP family intramembrane metalloprotease [Planctomycetaceae bacterium]